jgi:V8-like Glu-specific endopeptidase
VLTAAHCVTGSGSGIQFVPGYSGGSMPFGVWTSARVYADPSWIAHQDPAHDMAILKMQPQERNGRRVGVEDVVGANLLGLAPPAGTQVGVPAYPTGIDDEPVSCLSAVYRTGGYPAFDCPGYPGGTSGAPFLQSLEPSDGRQYDHRVVGVIGGLYQGGCSADTSYSAPFLPDVYQVWLRATWGSTPDVLPPPHSSGC